MSLTLPPDIYSPDQLSLRIQELRTVLAAQRDAVAKARVSGKTTSEAVAISPSLLALVKANGIAADNPRDIEGFIKVLEELRLKAPVVHIMLASLPTPAIVEQCTTWFRKEIHPSVLLTFVMSREIGGGVIVRTGSNVYDFSFRSQLLRHKNRISEIFAGV